jgi:hypothetical protein
MGKIKVSSPMLFYIAQLSMSGVVMLACMTLITLGRLVEPVVLAIFLVSLLASFLVTAKLLYESNDEKINIGLLILATVIGLTIGWFVAPPVVGSYSLSKMENENIKNLELIRDSITLYKVKTGGYPPFLVGGAVVGDPEKSTDPLIREGVLKSYPVNPFGVPENIVTWPVGFLTKLVAKDKRPCFVGADFLRNLQDELQDPEVVAKGQMSRFGLGTNARDVLVGSLLADLKFKPSKFGYAAWGGGGIGKKSLPWIPGMFFYKNWRNKGESETHFVVGVYGSFYEQGYDIFGKSPEEAILASDESGEGCPFKVGENNKLIVGNPDGKPDGVVYVFTDEGRWTPEGIVAVAPVKLETPEEDSSEQSTEDDKNGNNNGKNDGKEVEDSPWIK